MVHNNLFISNSGHFLLMLNTYIFENVLHYRQLSVQSPLNSKICGFRKGIQASIRSERLFCANSCGTHTSCFFSLMRITSNGFVANLPFLSNGKNSCMPVSSFMSILRERKRWKYRYRTIFRPGCSAFSP